MSATSTTTSHNVPPPKRRTIAARATITGVGLFTGVAGAITIAPGGDEPSRAGIWFARADLPGTPRVQACVANIAPERRRTLLVAPHTANGKTSSIEIHTVEHVLSALAGLGITDALLELSGPEVPIGDGSATLFVEAIRSVGVRELDPATLPARVPIVITQPLVVSDKGGEISALPSDMPGCEMVYELDYGDAAPIARQSASLLIAPPPDGTVFGYGTEIAAARTFCLQEEAIAMRKMGMFQSFEPKDLLVIGPNGPIDNTFRFPNEPARHKLLDMLGDLSLAGRPIQGRLVAKRSGHALNHQMAAALAAL